MADLRAFAPLLLIVLLAACGGSGSGQVQSASAAAKAAPKAPLTTLRPSQRTGKKALPTAQIQALPGVDGVIGATTADLTRQFGTARLDVWEGDARKLQFLGGACVLDVYLYPPAEGREPQATYVDARRSDGRDVDRAACITALRKR